MGEADQRAVDWPIKKRARLRQPREFVLDRPSGDRPPVLRVLLDGDGEPISR